MKRTSLLAGLLALTICGQAHAQSFDLANNRVPLTSLDGLWRFHTGDDRAWADPRFDDSQWSLLRSDEDWAQQGYEGYGGMAWYRFQINVPAGLEHVSLYLPYIYTSYEVYADGALIGAYGKMPPDTEGDYGGQRFFAYALPAGSGAARKVQISLRVWHDPTLAEYMGGGPKGKGGLVGDSKLIDRRVTQDRTQLFWGATSDQTLALLQTLAALGALALFLARRKQNEYLWFCIMMLMSATSRGLKASFSTHIWDYNLFAFVRDVPSISVDLALIFFLLTLLRSKRSRRVNFFVAALILVGLTGLLADVPGLPVSSWALFTLGNLTQVPLYIFECVLVLGGIRKRFADARLLAAPVMLRVCSIFFADGVIIANQLGWQQGIVPDAILTQTPCPISVSQVADGLFLVAVLAILILRFARISSQEERFAGEVQAARNVQQYLIPEQLPKTPGLAISSEYRPAREVGGDFFQVLPNPDDGSVLIVVGDVAGHGMEAGMLATLIVGAIRTAAEFTSDPGNILSLLNKRMQGRGLATCLAMRVEKDGNATLANAGHLPPYLNGNELEMEGALPLGAVAGISFPAVPFKLVEGDTLLLMTDGVAEAQNAAGQLFGFERIEEMVRTGAAASALASAAQAFGQEDDITVLTVRSVAAYA
jgi:hypothetical protein